jgi:hypothetical protein
MFRKEEYENEINFIALVEKYLISKIKDLKYRF